MKTKPNYINGSLACQQLGDCSLFELPFFIEENNIGTKNKEESKFNIKKLFQKTQKNKRQ